VIETIYGIAGRIFQHNKPVRDALYRRFVKTFPCCACRAWWYVDPAHTGPHSHGAKGCDLRVIPLCRKCHEAFDKSPFKFACRHGLDIEQLIVTYRELYILNYPERFTKEAA
jgi:hypothetical protein